jgi:protein-disulfide isomerase
MRKILLALAALTVLGGVWAAPQARADEVPQITPNDRVQGNPNAPITVFEFFSFTCPHCADFAANTFPEVKKNWIDPGKVKWVYRDYPLDRNALKAAMVARCAPPDRYPGFFETLFAQQANWGMMDDPAPALKRIALLGGITAEQFDKCINDDAMSKSIVAAEYDAQKKYGVDSTPTFFVNGKKAVGEMPYDQFAKLLAGEGDAAAGPSSPAPEAQPATPAAPNPATEPARPAASAPTAPVPHALTFKERVQGWIDWIKSWL